jgi:hypothetical protein
MAAHPPHHRQPGLRYDIEVQPFDERDNPAFPDPKAYPVDKNNFSPRLGLTYDLSGKGRAVARGGYGRFYDKTHFELISAILTAGVFSDSFNVFFPTNNADPGPSTGVLPLEPMLAGGPTVNRALLAQRYPAGSRIKNAGNVTLDNPDRTIPYSDQFTAGYERQLGSALSVSADYVHARARDQLMLRDLNPGLRATTARTSTSRASTARRLRRSVFTPVKRGGNRLRRARGGPRQAFRRRLLVPRVVHAWLLAEGNTSGLFIPTSPFQVLDD